MQRIATHDDIEPVIELIRLMYREIGFGRVNEQRALDAATHIIGKNQCGVVLHKGRIVGSIGLDIGTLEYGDNSMLLAKWFFIHPDHRADKNDAGENAGHGAKLVAWAKSVADTAGLPLVVDMVSAVDTKTKLKWFRKRMTQFKGTFLHVPSKLRAA